MVYTHFVYPVNIKKKIVIQEKTLNNIITKEYDYNLKIFDEYYYCQSITGYLYVNYHDENIKISALSNANLSFKPSSNRSALTSHGFRCMPIVRHNYRKANKRYLHCVYRYSIKRYMIKMRTLKR